MQLALKTLHFLKHLVGATNKYNAHSPFLFELFNQVFNKPLNVADSKDFSAYRNEQRKDPQTILFEEHGAGNNQGQKLSVAQIARQSAISKKEARIIIHLCKHLKPKTILELGTSTGVSTHALSIGAPEAKITTVEGCGELAQHIRSKTKDENIEIIASTFEAFFDRLQQAPQRWDLIYIDGNHSYEATTNYFQLLKKYHIHANTCIIFDDIYWSEGMVRAWNAIVEDPDNTLTIDLFSLGLVFFNKDLSKQHFKVRI